MQGYHGVNCSIQCPFPTYGIRCQTYCTCSRDLCDVSTGCYTLVDSILIFPYFALETLNYFILNCIIYLFTARIIPPPKKKIAKSAISFSKSFKLLVFKGNTTLSMVTNGPNILKENIKGLITKRIISTYWTSTKLSIEN